MVGEDRVIMSVKELRRVHVIRQTMEKKLTQIQAGTVLGLTTRHIRRLIERVEQAGDQGLAHRGRGKPSNRRIPDTVKAMMLKLYAQRYGGFGPTLAAEKLAERQGLTLSDRPCGGGCARAGSSISRGGSGPIGRGGSGKPTWGRSSSWMARTMTGWRVGVPTGC
jgi:Helix-turn-helix domain